MRYSAKAWLAVGGVVAVAEYYAPHDDMLSHGVDTALEHPVGKVIVPAIVVITALHLINRLPIALDPYSRAFALWKREAISGGTMVRQ